MDIFEKLREIISQTQITNLLPDFEIVYDFGGDVLLKNSNL